jgi:hypothetical protein
MPASARTRWLLAAAAILAIAAGTALALVWPDLMRRRAFAAIDPFQPSADNWNRAIRLRDGGEAVVTTISPQLRDSIRLSYPGFFADDTPITWHYATATFIVGRIDAHRAGIVMIDDASGRWTVIGTNDLTPRPAEASP